MPHVLLFQRTLRQIRSKAYLQDLITNNTNSFASQKELYISKYLFLNDTHELFFSACQQLLIFSKHCLTTYSKTLIYNNPHNRLKTLSIYSSLFLKWIFVKLRFCLELKTCSFCNKALRTTNTQK